MLQVSILLLLLNNVYTEDVFYTINNNNVLHRLNDKFLGISIDPAVLLAGANLSDASLLLAKHLSPAYIRLAGPSTPFVKYLDNEEDLILRNSEEGNNVIITPSMWFGINEWFNLAGLTPVFGINDKETEKGVWDPKSTMPLLEMSDKFGVNCYWQLGYDCSNKTTLQYVENLNILKQTLNGFPGHNESWKIVSSDLSKCISDDLDVHEFEKYVNDLDENTNAIMWESALIPKSVLGFKKSEFWTSVPKDPKLVTFSSAMKWARQVGEAAVMEYDVIFRQPRILEMTYDTPVYWFSFMHKKLMGNNVLQLISTNSIADLSTFVHCTKRQNNFVRTGAVTVMAINDGSETHTVNVNVGLMGTIMLDKSMEIQTYFLTASEDNPSDVNLNNQKLSMSMLKKPDDILKPKLRRAKIRSSISLKVPPQTIGFFVLTGARNALCIKNEENLNTILAEINEDQEQPIKLEGRRLEVDKTKNINSDNLTFENIKKSIINEREDDKQIYDKMVNIHKSSNSSAANFKDKANRNKEKLHKHLKDYIEKAKLDDNKNLGVKRQRQKITQSTTPSNNLYFTINEIEDILKRRAKAYAESKNIKLTDSELNMLIDKATVKLPKHFVAKRDINKILLEEKANFHKNNMLSQEAYEQRANELKLQPKYTFQRSFLNLNRNPRNINKILLKSRAMLEEHKKYMLERNKHLQSAHSRKQHIKSSRSKRDINLDLLKTRIKPTSQSSGRKIAVQPSLNEYRQYLRIQKEKQAPQTSSEQFSDEFLKDSEEFTMEETHTSSKLFTKEKSSDTNLVDFEDLDDETKAKPSKFNFYSLSSKPKWEIFFPKKSLTRNKKKSDTFGKYSKLFGTSSEVNDFEDHFQPCSHEWGFSLDDSEEKNNKLSFDHLLQRNVGKNKKEKSSVVDLDSDESNFFQNMEYGFFRKKREINSIAEEKLKMVNNDIKSEVKALKKEIQKDKVKYLQQKFKNKIKLKQRKHFEKLKQKGLQQHIQIVSKSTKNKNNLQQLWGAKSKTNNTYSLSSHMVKRSLINNNLNGLFGQYQPLTAGLRPWKPMDILSLQNDLYLKTLPLYNWMQTQNLRNSLLQNNFLGRRRRRYIETDSINSIENEIFSDERHRTNLNKIKNMKRGKYLPEAFLKEKQKANKEIQSKGGKIQKVSYAESGKLTSVDEIANNKMSERVVDKMLPKEKLTYLERVLGKNKIEPLDNFVTKSKKFISNMGHSIKNFFMHIF